MPGVFGGCGAVDDDKPVFRSVPEDDEIVDHAALVVKEHPVAARMDRHVGNGHGHQRVEPRLTAVAADQELSHMTGIEKCRGLAGVFVFGEDPFVLHGHFPSAEGDDTRF